MKHIVLIPPHHLFEQHPAIEALTKQDVQPTVVLVEEYLYFRQYRFHKQKIAYHRATMRYYADLLRSRGIIVEYITSDDERSDVRTLISSMANSTEKMSLHSCEVTDNWLNRRIEESAEKSGIRLTWYDSPMFLNTQSQIITKLNARQRLFQTDFYIAERKERGILLDEYGKPEGGSWTYDTENRKRYPKGATPPHVDFPTTNQWWLEAVTYTESLFPDNYGKIHSSLLLYPVTHDEARQWFEQFLRTRYYDFGIYEDALVQHESVLHHSVLTPMLNIGLLTPDYVLQRALVYSKEHSIPLNSTEGFIRQIMGWREFIRGVYELKGTEERTRNYWGFTRRIPDSFWSGTTQLIPLDSMIAKLIQTAYAHHIERLMVAGSIMLMCEFHPDHVYRWFMELFIDAYDWVMVPNVYGMSQFADGGLMSTKPYISGSNYLTKMGDYPKGEWQQIWDALFWRFMDVHRDFFGQNPRLGMLLTTLDKMPTAKREHLMQEAHTWISSLDKVS